MVKLKTRIEFGKMVSEAVLSNGTANGTGEPYRVDKAHYFGDKRKMRIVCVGAGFSGLYLGILHEHRMKYNNVEYVCYEKNPSIGGTWYENQYPNCRCDIPSHEYTISFEPKADWPEFYARQPEILQYMKDMAEKHHLMQHVKLSHKICGATWDEDISKWRLRVQPDGGEEFEDLCDVFVNAGGILNKWQWPTIPGLHDFKGKLLHSARWDQEYDFRNKTIAVIGVGSSAIQVVPAMQKVEGAKLLSFIRSPTWISPAPGLMAPKPNDPKLDQNLAYVQEEIDRFKKDPKYFMEMRQDMHATFVQNFPRSFKNQKPQLEAVGIFTDVMKERLQHNEELVKLMIPSFPVGCRRLSPGPGFLESLVKPNVTVISKAIDRISEKGLVTSDGVEHQVDVLVCCTGFDTSFRPKFPLIGRNGKDLVQEWTHNPPEAYLGIAVPDIPNYFMFMSANTPVTNGTLLGAVQVQGDYVWKMVRKMQRDNIASVSVSKQATDDLNEHHLEYMKDMIWSEPCRSWYKHNHALEGRVTAVWSGSATQ